MSWEIYGLEEASGSMEWWGRLESLRYGSLSDGTGWFRVIWGQGGIEEVG